MNRDRRGRAAPPDEPADLETYAAHFETRVHEQARVHGQEQQHALAAERSFRRHALEAAAKRADAVTLGDRLHGHEADIVPVADMGRTGIAEPDEKQHGGFTSENPSSPPPPSRG